MTICLGIESTAHTLGVGIFENEKILASEKAYYQAKHAGIKPSEAADHHAAHFSEVLQKALQAAKISLNEIDVFAYSHSPGLGPCLAVGCAAAKALALKYNKPLMPVNHCVAHIEITKLVTKMKDPLIAYASGGNTQIIFKDKNRYHVLGETLDMGIGNAIDTFAREAGFEKAHGGEVERIALQGKKYIELPYTVKGMDIVLSGLLTAITGKLGQEKIEDLCYSLQETAYAMYVEAIERALALTKKKELIFCGGVACNKRLQEMLSIMSKEHNAKFGVADNQFNVDNGAMIAWVGLLMYKSGIKTNTAKLGVNQRFRTDQVELRW